MRCILYRVIIVAAKFLVGLILRMRVTVTLVAARAFAARDASLPSGSWIPNDEFRNCTVTVEDARLCVWNAKRK